MGLARSDKISFSELVPNLITPQSCCRGKELERCWRHSCSSCWQRERMGHCQTCVRSKRVSTVSWGGQAPSVHRPWPVSPGYSRRQPGGASEVTELGFKTLDSILTLCMAYVGLSFPIYKGIWTMFTWGSFHSKIQTIQHSLSNTTLGIRTPFKNQEFFRTRKKYIYKWVLLLEGNKNISKAIILEMETYVYM
jgi:hypothetical protein